MTEQDDRTTIVDRALNHADEIIYRFRVRPTHSFEFLSPSTSRILGVDADDLIADPSLANTLIDDAAFEASVMTSELRVREPYRIRVKRPDGEYRWLAVTNFTVRDDAGKVELIEGIARDVTPLVEVEGVLQEHARGLDETLTMARAGSWTWTLATEEAHWSRSLFDLCGLEPAPQAPSFDDVVELIHPDDVTDVLDRGFEAIAERRSFSVDLRIVRRDGRTLHVRARGGPVFNDAGEIVRMIGTVQDLTSEPAVPNRTMAEASTLIGTLSDRELEVLTMLGQGLDPRAIASALDISIHTVRDHLKRVRSKLNVRTQVEAVLIAVDAGIIVRPS